MFIDADITWQPQHILQLLKHNKEFIIGIYPNKSYDENYNLLPSSKIKSHNVVDNLIEIEYAATGFTLIQKSVFEKIKNDVLTFNLPNGITGENVKVYNFFDCNVINEDYLTEDFHFSHLYNKNGGQIYADITIQLKHSGTHEYFQKNKN